MLPVVSAPLSAFVLRRRHLPERGQRAGWGVGCISVLLNGFTTSLGDCLLCHPRSIRNLLLRELLARRLLRLCHERGLVQVVILTF